MRFGEYKDALILIERYPLFGVGFTGTPDLDIYLGVSMLYLIIAENMGIIGLALFAAVCTLARRVVSSRHLAEGGYVRCTIGCPRIPLNELGLPEKGTFMLQRSGWLVVSALMAGMLAVLFAWGEPYPAAADSIVAPLAGSRATIRVSAAVTGSLYLPAITGAQTMLYLPMLIGNATAPVGAEEGGSLTAIIGALATTIDIPPGAIGEDATLVVQLAALPPQAGSPLMVGDALDIQLRTDSDSTITSFLQPFTLTVAYGAADLAGVNESLLALHYWNTTASQWQPIATTVDAGS